MTVQTRATAGVARAESDEEWLPLQVAALRLNLSIDALRRRLKRGELRGRRVRGARGQRWEVLLGADGPTAAGPVEPRDGGQAMASETWTQLMRELLGENAELGRQIVRLNDQRAELFGRCGYLQGQLAAAHDQIRALQAPKEDHASRPAPRRSWWRVFGN